MRPRNPYRVRSREDLKERFDTSTRITRHTVRSLAEQAGLSPAVVGHLLTGERSTVSEAAAQRLSAALGLRLVDLFVPNESQSSDSDTMEGSPE
jgi:transcriptional regulator with XRE-family HTH domain